MKKVVTSNTLKGVVRNACEFPTEKDLDWMESHIQRHAVSFDAWWAEFGNTLTGRDVMRAIIVIWEAGRGGKETNF